MKKNKYIFVICIAVLLFILGLSYLIIKNNGNSGLKEDAENITQAQIDIYDNENIDSSNSSSNNAEIILKDNETKITGNGATAKENIVTISKAGIYNISGSLSDGQIIVDASKNDDITLVLNGVDITCKNSSVIYAKQASKTVIKLDKENKLTDSADYIYEQKEDEEPNATIFSKDDLVICGDGILNLNSNFTNSIFSKDSLVIEAGNINIESKGHGIKGRDLVHIKNGNITIKSSLDGIKTTNDVDEDKGYIIIENGSINIEATQDGISSEKYIKILNGNFNIASGGGSKNSSSSQNWGMWGKNNSQTEEESAKGMKAVNDIELENGTFKIDSSDDSIHSNSNVNILNGEYEISSGDDGIHADTLLSINGGKINITKSYEGIEAENIYINAGDIDIVASDDGINVNGGNDMSAMGGRPGQNNFSNTTVNNYLKVNGGSIYLNTSGDGLDSNGSVIVTDGDIIVEGPTNDGNGALDYQNDFKITGGTLVAVGSSGMAQSVSNGSTVNTLFASFSSTQSANSVISIKNSNGENIISFTPCKTYSSIVISNPKLEKNNTYSIYIDDNKMYDVTIFDTISSVGNTRGNGFGNNMGRPGGMNKPMR